MKRPQVLAFSALVLATIAAFFITQHLKVSTPLINGFPAPDPAVINPLDGRTCYAPARKKWINHRRMEISFYLQNSSDTVDVYIVDQAGQRVATLASGRYMVVKKRSQFVWNGRVYGGGVAPDGSYTIRVVLESQGRTVTISNSAGPEQVTVETRAPAPVIASVSPQAIAPSPRAAVRIRYRGNEGRAGTVMIYRTDLPGWQRRRPVKDFLAPGKRGAAVWNGLIHMRPAPAGTYLVRLEVVDAACNRGFYPRAVPPASRSQTGVTVRYLAAQPPAEPVVAGGRASVRVFSARRRYAWSLTRAGGQTALERGSDTKDVLHVRLPRTGAGLYELTIRAGAHRTTVPLIADAGRREPILVVLPALTWLGSDPVDETGDGIPDTLSDGRSATLARPYVDGWPPGLAGEVALLSVLAAGHRRYDLTTDLGLALRSGPQLAGHSLVVLAGSERWLPASLSARLKAYALGGGNVLVVGEDSLHRSVDVAEGTAFDPSPASRADAFGVPAGSGTARQTLGRGTVVELRSRLHFGDDAAARRLLGGLLSALAP